MWGFQGGENPAGACGDAAFLAAARRIKPSLILALLLRTIVDMLAAAKDESVPLLAASLLSENSCPGFGGCDSELRRVIELANVLNASGLAASLYDDRIGSRDTGKERDQESGLDYFGARYFGSALGRFTSPDPSNLGVDFYLPQTWNRYTYAINNPLSVVDRNGLWPFYIHNDIIDESFPGLSINNLQVLRDASWKMDFGPGQQDPSKSFEHGMSDGTTNQNPMEAQNQGDDYISQQVQAAQDAQADWASSGQSGISPEALTHFGNALHTATDRTSPSHRGNQPWHNDPWYNKRTRTHVENESTINAGQMAAAKRAAQDLFRRTFGSQFDLLLIPAKDLKGCVTAGGQTTCDR